MSHPRDGWSDPVAVRRKLDAWWKGLRPDRRQSALTQVDVTLPEWLAQDLIRAGLPLEVNPGFEDRTLLGQFVTPSLVADFLNDKWVAPSRKWWQFWKR